MKTWETQRWNLELNKTAELYDFGEDKYGKWEVLVVETDSALEAFMSLKAFGVKEFLIGVPKNEKCFICPPEERYAFLRLVDDIIDDDKDYYVAHYAPELLED